MANNIKVDVNVNSNLPQVTKDAKAAKKAVDELAATSKTQSVAVIAAQKGVSASNALKQDRSSTATNLSRGLAGQTGAEGRDFAKQAQGLGGLVHVYATFAANLFAVSAAFGALSRAADTTNMVKGLDQLGAASGRSLGRLSKQLSDATDGAISLRDAMTATAQATAGGMTNQALLRMGQVAKQASQALGVAMPDALSRISRGIVKLEPELLDEIGILVRVDKASADYARSIGKTAASLTDFEKRQGFANAVLEQGEKKFNAIKIDANPYSKILASMENIAHTGLELVNKVLGPILTILSSSPTALSAAMAGVAALLLKQAVPALGMFKENLAAATEQAQYIANKKNLIAKQAAKEYRDQHARDVESMAENEIAAVEKAEAKINAIKTGSMKSSSSKLLSKPTTDLTEKDYAQLERTAKKLDKTNAELAAGYREYAKAAKEHVNAEKLYQKVKEDNAILDEKRMGVLTTQGRLQTVADRANLDASARIIKSNAAQLASTEGYFAAVKQGFKDVSLARAKDMQQQLTVARFDSNGNRMFDTSGKALTDKIDIPRMGLLQATTTRVGVAVGSATTAIGGMLNFLGPWMAAIGLVTGALSILVSYLSTNEKETKKFETSLSATNDAAATIASTLDSISTKDPFAAFSAESIQARATALQNLSDSVKDLANNFDDLKFASSGTDNFFDAIWDSIGRGSADKLSTSLSVTVVRALSSLTAGPARDKAREVLGNIIGKGIDLDNIREVENALRKLDNSQISQVSKSISLAIKGIATDSSNTASVLTGSISKLDELSKLVQTQNNSLVSNDPLAKLGSGMLGASADITKAIQDPIHAIELLNNVIEDNNKLSLLGTNTQSDLLDAKNGIIELKKEYGAYTAQIIDAEQKILKLKADNKYNTVVNTADGGQAVGISQVARELEDKLASIKAEGLNIEGRMAVAGGKLAKQVATDFINIGLKNLNSSLSAALVEASATAARGYLSALKGAGVDTAAAEGKIRAAELNSQKSLLDATYQQVRAQQKNTAVQEIANAELAIFNNILPNFLAGKSADPEQIKKAEERSIQLEKDLQDAKRKKDIVGYSPKQLNSLASQGISSGVSQEVLSSLAPLLQAANSYAIGAAKISAQAAINEINTYAAKANEKADSAKKVISNEIEGADTQLKILDIITKASDVYDEINEKKIAQLGVLKLQKQFESDLVDIDKNRDIIAKATTASTKVESSEALSRLSTQEAVKRAKLTADISAVEATALDKKLKGIETLRVKEATRATEELANRTALKTADLSIQEAELKYNLSTTAVSEKAGVVLANNIALQKLELETATERNAAAVEYENKVAALSIIRDKELASTGKISQNSIEENARIVAFGESQIAVIDAKYNAKLKELGVDRLIATEQALLNERAKANGILAEDQANAMEKMVGLTTNLSTAFGDVGTAIGTVSELLLKMAQDDINYLNEKKQLEEDRNKAPKDSDAQKKAIRDLTILEDKRSNKELDNLGSIAGATKKVFSEKSFAYKALAAVEKAAAIQSLALKAQDMATTLTSIGPKIANGVAKLFEQGGWAGFAGAAAFLALMGSLGFGGGSAKMPSGFSAEEQQKVQGTGQSYVNGQLVNNGGGVMGDPTARSEAITNSLSRLEDSYYDNYKFTKNSVYTALIAIRDNTEQFVKALLGVTGITGGVSGFGTTEGASSTLFGLFSKSTTVEDTGVIIEGALDALIAGQGTKQQYENVIKKSSSLFGLIKSSSSNTNLKELPDTINKYVSGIFKGFKETVQILGTDLAQETTTVDRVLAEASIKVKTSGKGLSGSEFATAIMSEIGIQLDIVAKRALPSIVLLSEEFQGLNETFTEFAIRIVDDADNAKAAFNSIGNVLKGVPDTLGQVSTEIINRQLDAVRDLAIAQDNAAKLVRTDTVFEGREENTIRTTFGPTPESLRALAAAEIEYASATQELTLNQSSNLNSVERLTQVMLKAAGGADRFATNMSNFADNFLTEEERLAIKQDTLTSALSDIGYSSIDTRDKFKDLVQGFQVTNDETAKTFVQLTALAGLFNEVYEDTKKVLTAEELRKALLAQEIEILNLQGRSYEALIKQRAEEISLLDPALVAGQETINTLKDKLTTEALLTTEMQLQNKTEEVLANTRRKELLAMSETDRAIQKRIYLLQDEATIVTNLKNVESLRSSVASAYQSFVEAAKSSAEALVNAANSITSGYLSAKDTAAAALLAVNDAAAAEAERLNETAITAAKSMKDFAKSIRDFVESITAASVRESDQMSYLQARFNDTVTKAKAGDETALENLTSNASALLEKGKDNSATFLDFARLNNRTIANLTDVADTLDAKADPTLTALGYLTDEQKAANDYAKQALELQKALKLANEDLAKWTEAIDESGASTESILVDYAKDWREASATDILAQSKLLEATKLVADINTKIPTALGSLRDAVKELVEASKVLSTQILSFMSNTFEALRNNQISAAQASAAVAATGTPLVNDKVNEVATSTGSEKVWQSQTTAGTAVITLNKDKSDYLINSADGINQFTGQQVKSWITDKVNSGSGLDVYYGAIANGLSSATVEGIMGWDPGSINKLAVANNLPTFASGGDHVGGLRLVGENGPEIEATGPSRIFNATQTRGMMQQDNRELIAEIRLLRAEVKELKEYGKLSADNTKTTAKQLTRWDADGLPATTT